MTHDEAERLLAACRLIGDHPEEQRLLKAPVDEIQHYRSGTSQTYEVTFGDRSRAAFKPIEGVEAQAPAFGHTALSVILNDYAAWLVARGLGYEALVRGVVIVTCPEPGVGIGSLQTWLDGDASGVGWEHAGQLRAAGLFDAVIGQQDRNRGNFVYDESTDELGLFDQSFTFPLPGHQAGASDILARLHSDASAQLDESLVAALDRFVESDEQGALPQILPPDRYERINARIVLMRERGELLRGGEY